METGGGPKKSTCTWVTHSGAGRVDAPAHRASKKKGLYWDSCNSQQDQRDGICSEGLIDFLRLFPGTLPDAGVSVKRSAMFDEFVARYMICEGNAN